MAQQGAALQNYNNELVKCIEDLCNKRDDLQRQIMIEEEEKHKLQNDIRVISEKLAKTNESLAKKISARNEFDKTIAETEAAYMKVSFDLFVTGFFTVLFILFKILKIGVLCFV